MRLPERLAMYHGDCGGSLKPYGATVTPEGPQHAVTLLVTLLLVSCLALHRWQHWQGLLVTLSLTSDNHTVMASL